MEAKKRYIYKSDSRDFDEAKADLIEANDFDEDEVSDSMVWNYIADVEQEDWNMALDEIRQACQDSRIMVDMTLGLWDGPAEGGFIEDDISQAISAFSGRSGYDNIDIWDENGHLYFMGYHHDGRNIAEFLLLSDEGFDWYDEHIEYLSERECHAGLHEHGFLTLPRVAASIYGCPEEEWD